jgi:phytoene dehydrogenase-like protein
MKNDTPPYVVVGGGIAGLTAACYLARTGAAVTLLERAAHVGGFATSACDDGYIFNRGIHALYPGGAASEVLHDLHITYRYGTPGDIWTLGNGAFHLFPASPLALVRSPLLGVRAKLELIRMFATLSRVMPSTVAHLSTDEWLKRTFQYPEARRLIAAIARTFTYTSALDVVSAEVFVVRVQQTLKHPVQYIDGGWQTLVDALRHKATEAGARIMEGAHAVAVEHTGECATGVRLRDGTTLPAAGVVLAVRPADAVALLDAEVAPGLYQCIERSLPAEVACLDVALERLPNLRYLVVQALDHACFLSVQSRFARMAQQGDILSVFRQLDPRQPADPHAVERELEAFIDAVQPGWREVVRKRRFLPHMTAVGMLPAATTSGFAGRPPICAGGLHRLALAGDWIGAEGFLVDASFASGREAARLLTKEKA